MWGSLSLDDSATSDDVVPARTLMMGTEMAPETSVSSCNQLTRLIAREDFIE
jgi:hypothetical protein